MVKAAGTSNILQHFVSCVSGNKDAEQCINIVTKRDITCITCSSEGLELTDLIDLVRPLTSLTVHFNVNVTGSVPCSWTIDERPVAFKPSAHPQPSWHEISSSPSENRDVRVFRIYPRTKKAQGRRSGPMWFQTWIKYWWDQRWVDFLAGVIPSNIIFFFEPY